MRAQLSRILASEDFVRSERQSRFLRFIVDEELAGRGDRLKAYAIALSVFDRPPSFDPQADPLVRIEATRLRRALEHFYLTAGRSDRVVISVPKGAYVPHFTEVADPPGEMEDPTDLPSPAVCTAAPVPSRPRRVLGHVVAFALALAVGGATVGLARWSAERRHDPDIAANHAPGLAVLPFRSVGSDATGQRIADGLDEAIIDELAKLGDVRVLGRAASQLAYQAQASGRIPEAVRVRYFVEGSLSTQDARTTVAVRLVESERQQVVWSARVPLTLPPEVIAAQADIATTVARLIAQPYGTMFRIESGPDGAKVSQGDLSCISGFYAYRMAISSQAHRAVRHCLEETVELAPRNATAWAMLAQLHLDEIRFGLNPSGPVADVVKRATTAAENALRREPDNIRALQAAMLARFFAGDVEGGRLAGERALQINPGDTEVLGEFGTRLAQSGDWIRGGDMLEAALAQSPPNAGLLHGHAAFAFLMGGQTRKAVEHLKKTNLGPYPSVLFVRMLVQAEAGDMKAARAAFLNLQQTAPEFISNLDEQVGVRNIPASDLERINAIVARVKSTTVAAHVGELL